MSNRLLKILPLVMALLLVFSVSAFAVLADEAPETVAAPASETSAESEDVDGVAADPVSAETPAAAESTETPAESTSNVPWKLIIAVGVIVVIIAVLFILAKTNSKLGQKIAKFFKDYKSELKKIVWMPWKDLLKATGVVLVVLLAAGIIIGLLDYGFSSLVKLLSSIGS